MRQMRYHDWRCYWKILKICAKTVSWTWIVVSAEMFACSSSRFPVFWCFLLGFHRIQWQCPTQDGWKVSGDMRNESNFEMDAHCSPMFDQQFREVHDPLAFGENFSAQPCSHQITPFRKSQSQRLWLLRWYWISDVATSGWICFYCNRWVLAVLKWCELTAPSMSKAWAAASDWWVPCNRRMFGDKADI